MRLSQELEQFYRQVHAADGGPAPQFPRSYPLGALVGCVDVVDVLTVSPRATTLLYTAAGVCSRRTDVIAEACS